MPNTNIGLTSLLYIIFHGCIEVQHKPIKRLKKGFKKKGAKKPKCALAWRTGLSGVPPDSVRCPGPYKSKLATFGFQKSRSAIIYRTIKCTSRATARQRNSRLQRSPATLQCADSSRRSQSSH